MVGHPKAQATGIKSWPLDDRPREKLLKKGAGTLSNSELLAILLRTGKLREEYYRRLTQTYVNLNVAKNITNQEFIGSGLRINNIRKTSAHIR